MSLSFRRDINQRDDETAATIAKLKQGQDKLAELVQVLSMRDASPQSADQPNTRTQSRRWDNWRLPRKPSKNSTAPLMPSRVSGECTANPLP